MENTNKFEYKEDEDFFIDLLADGNKELFNSAYRQLFDFSDAEEKRKTYIKDYKLLKQKVLKRYNECLLKLNNDCTHDKYFEIDHLIPLSTNKLNKKFRKIKAEPKKKVPSQSFGSNHIDNLILSCHNCNSYKKHRLLSKDVIKRVLEEIEKKKKKEEYFDFPCKKCGKKMVKKYVYGYIDDPDKISPREIPAGCVIEPDSPKWKCENCGLESGHINY